MKKNILIGGFIGFIAGIADVIPMIIQKLTWDACISAWSMWIVVGIFIASINWKINSVIKGILVAFLTLFPISIIIGFQEPISLIPISIMTLILGSLCGYFINKFTKTQI